MSVWQTSPDGSTWTDLVASNLTRRRVSAGIDTFSFVIDYDDALTPALPYAFDSQLHIRYGTDRVFQGRVATLPRLAAAPGESIEVVLEGPWQALETTYQQGWKAWDEEEEEPVDIIKSRCILFMDLDGERITSGAQIDDAIDYAISRGAPIAVGTIDAGVALPFDERENISCAEVIHTVLRYLPDYVAWFDYTVSPPAFNCRRRASLSAASVAVADCDLVRAVARTDLRIPGIVIQYEKTNSTDGNVRMTVETDSAGDTNHLRTVHAVFDLEGKTRTYLRAEIETDDIPPVSSEDEEEALLSTY